MARVGILVAALMAGVCKPPGSDAFRIASQSPSALRSVGRAARATRGVARARRAAPRAALVDDLVTVSSKTLDTFEDALLHIRRLGAEAADTSEDAPLPPLWDDPSDERPTVVVLGTGWSSHALMKIIDVSLFRVLVVSPVNHFVFTPMLAASAVGTVEYRSITEPVRVSNPLVEYIEGSAVGADPAARTLDVELAPLLSGRRRTGGDRPAEGAAAAGAPERVRLRYDTLVVACGAQVSASRVPGAEEHCFKLKQIEDAQRLRRAVSEAFDLAALPGLDKSEKFRLLHFVIVGGGPTGVELAGEFTDFIREAVRVYPRLAPLTRVSVMQGADELLMQFDPELRTEARAGLERRGVRVRTGVRVEAVEAERIVIRPKTSEAQESIPCGLVVWCAGNSQVPFVSSLLDALPPIARAPDGRVAVDNWLRVRVEGADGPSSGRGSAARPGSILAMGDAAYVCDDDALEDALAEAARSGVCAPLPQTAQVAAQQGAYIARMLNRDYDLSATPPALAPPKPVVADAVTEFWNKAANVWVRLRGLERAPKFSFLNLGILAAIGGGEALAQVELGDSQLFQGAGSAGFLLWRSVYIVKQVAVRNRILVAFDWAKTALFGRDMTRF